jgi:hypothetical protein
MLVWLSSLEEGDRNIYIEGLDKSERTLALALIKGFYLATPEMEREISTGEALRLLNGAWTTKSAVWVSQRWDALSKILAAVVNALSRAEIDKDMDISAAAEALLKSLVGDTPNAPRAILAKLVEFARSFGFSGVAVLVDKIDETPATSNSAEATTRLVHPLLSHIQLLEVDGFSWVLFLWSKVQDHFNGEKFPVRLDKLAHADIKWDVKDLRAMVDARIKFFSGGKGEFKDIFEEPGKAGDAFASLAAIASNSPRELIKLLDTIFREHDARKAQQASTAILHFYCVVRDLRLFRAEVNEKGTPLPGCLLQSEQPRQCGYRRGPLGRQVPSHANAHAVELTARVAGLEYEEQHVFLLFDLRGLPLRQPMPRIKPTL